MKKRLLFFLVIFLVNSVYAQQDNLYNSQNLVVNIDVSSEAVLKPTSSNYNVMYVTVNLSHFPYENLNQEIINFEVSPEADMENNAIFFRWDNPDEKIDFGYNARIRTGNNIIKIREKIPFPLKNLPDEVKQFTKPGEIIDSDNKEVVRLASRLAEGEDDLYVVVHKIAEWTKNNIEYNLSTLTAEVSQSASWVLENRQGVCDELTSLFIAMLRSLGIPGKFISGVSYTNSTLFPQNWGSHGWAEIYFPGYGWVPYDVTFGEFGYVDPTHVKLKESFDSNEPSAQYRWVAKNVELETKGINIDTSLEEMYGTAKDSIKLNIGVLKQNVGFGSYNLIEVTLENLEDYYISSELYLSRPKELEINGNAFVNVLLKPNEKKNVFWIAKLTEDLDANFIYTFPIMVITLNGLTKSVSFKSTITDIVYSFEEINNILEQKKEEEEKVYSRDVGIDCNIDKEEFYAYEKALLQCKIKNTGNIFLENLRSCFENQCEEFDLGITQEKNLNFSLEELEEGKKESVLSLRNADVSKAEYIGYDVLDRPEIKIKDVEFPESVNYEDSFTIEFLLSKESKSIPKNVVINVLQNNFEKIWDVKELPNDRLFVLRLRAKDLGKGTNEFNVIVDYEDGNGMTYETKETFSVELVNVTLIQNIMLVFNQLAFNLEKIPSQLFLYIFASIVVVFFIGMWSAFKKRIQR